MTSNQIATFTNPACGIAATVTITKKGYAVTFLDTDAVAIIESRAVMIAEDLLEERNSLRADRDRLEDLLLECLPFVEDAEHDPAYKTGYVKAIVRKIRAQFEPKKDAP
jgi:hypothetical protein